MRSDNTEPIIDLSQNLAYAVTKYHIVFSYNYFFLCNKCIILQRQPINRINPFIKILPIYKTSNKNKWAWILY